VPPPGTVSAHSNAVVIRFTCLAAKSKAIEKRVGADYVHVNLVPSAFDRKHWIPKISGGPRRKISGDVAW
jgi:hypothetical protein